jgi:23S rRNA pseudouridine1911/1915/1917 synthase
LPENIESHCVFIVEAEGEGQRADVYLSLMLPGLSRSRIQGLLKNGDILLNGGIIKTGKKLEEGDELLCRIPAPSHLRAEPYPMNLDIVYEDSSVLVINKPQGLVVHPAPGSPEKTLVHGLLAHCRDLSGINGVLRPGIVHRLDKDTSGLLVAAKNDEAHRSLAGQLQARTMKRQYLALVWGIIGEPAGVIEAPIGRDPKDRQKMTVAAGGKPAVTAYTVFDRLTDKTAVQCELQTGRTHQIRVHMRFLGYPIVGDSKYGRRKDGDRWPGQALHAWHLEFDHPVNHERMAFFAPPPEHFLNALADEGAVNTLNRMKLLEQDGKGALGNGH